MFKRCSCCKNVCFLIGMILFLVSFVGYAPVSRGLDLSTISIKNGMVKFTTIASYENFLSQIHDNDLVKSIIVNLLNTSRSSFQSLADSMQATKTATNELCPIHYLLNEYGMIVIGNWIIKVDKANERVGVLNIKNINYIDYLKNDNFYFNEIKWFTTEDDILPLLYENPNGIGTLSLNQLVSKSYLSNLDYQEAEQTDPVVTTRGTLPSDAIFVDHLEDGDWHRRYFTDVHSLGGAVSYKYSMEHEYNRYGIYYRLHLDITRLSPDVISGLKPMCGYSVAWYYKNKNNGGQNWGTDQEWEVQKKSSKLIYSGTRYLRQFQVGTTFYYQVWNIRTLSFVSYYNPMINIAKF